MTFDRAQFVADLRRLATMNVRWRHQGTSPETGMDCIGVLRWAYERQGLTLPHDLLSEWQWRRPPDGKRLLAILRQHFLEITKSEVEPSDLMVVYQRKNPCHVIAKISNTEIAEAYESRDGAVSRFLIRPLDPRHRIAACFRIPDIA
jgi:cell wall-associated NlpC family hydrolase